MNLMKFENAIVFLVLTIPFFYFFYLTLNNQIFGIDAWYWLKFGFKIPAYANLVSVLMFLSVFIFFSFVREKRHYFAFIASLFLLNLACLKLLEVELDDYIYFSLSYALLVWVKNKGIEPRVVAIAIVLFYLFFHSFSIAISSELHKEIQYNLASFIFIIPALYLMAKNRKFFDIALVLALTIVFSSGKFVSSALIIYIFAVYLNFLTSENFLWGKTALIFLAIFSLLTYYFSPINMVEANKIAFEKYCNEESKICNNWEEPQYGHYFSYLGYISNNSFEFGVCTCVAKDCLTSKITC